VELKFCKDCKHADTYNFYTRCIRDRKIVSYDLTDGGAIYTQSVFAEFERASIWPWRCGRKARFFESKVSK
jgi:hypothetical protein